MIEVINSKQIKKQGQCVTISLANMLDRKQQMLSEYERVMLIPVTPSNNSKSTRVLNDREEKKRTLKEIYRRIEVLNTDINSLSYNN